MKGSKVRTKNVAFMAWDLQNHLKTGNVCAGALSWVEGVGARQMF